MLIVNSLFAMAHAAAAFFFADLSRKECVAVYLVTLAVMVLDDVARAIGKVGRK